MKETNDDVARNAASKWCRCFKCDGAVIDKGLPYKCQKPHHTCQQWYDGYRTALLALDRKDHLADMDLSLQVD